MPFSLGLTAGLSPSASASSSISSTSQSSSSGISSSLSQRSASRRVNGCASFEKTTGAIMFNRTSILQPHGDSGSGDVASPLHTISNASHIFNLDIPHGINNLYALGMRRRNSTSVALSYQLVAGDMKRTSRYTPRTLSTSNSVGDALTDKSHYHDSVSLSRATDKFGVRENYGDINDGTASRHCKRQESCLHDEGTLTRAFKTKCAFSVTRVKKNGETVPMCRDRGNVASLRRSSSTAANLSSSYASFISSSSPSCASLRSTSSTSSTSYALSDIQSAAVIDDRNNHPYEKIIMRANCLVQVSSRLAFYRLYEFGGLVGQGNFSNVHVVYAESSGIKYAVKEIDKTRMHGKTHFVENEIAILKCCTHRNICRLFEAFQCSEFYFLVFEYAPVGLLSIVTFTSE